MKKMSIILSALMLITSLTGCAEQKNTIVCYDVSIDTGTSYSPTTELLRAERDFNAEPFVFTNADTETVMDFSLDLFKASYKKGENTMLSPLSVMYAFGMVTLGAKGETLTQMEEVFGLTKDELAETLTSIRSCLNGDEYSKVSLADSIWIKNSGFTPNEQFIEDNTRIYGADIFSAPFDGGTLNDINRWVEENTYGMIKNILDEIPDDAVMYLINTLAFDCEWAEKYSEYSVSNGEFTDEDGTLREVEFMSSEENHYLEGENYTGFIKYYANHNYGFAALLPDDGVTVGELISSLDASELNEKLSSPDVSHTVYTKTPKFSYNYGIELSDMLASMGMTDAFDSNRADLTGLGEADGNIYLSRVIHKTFIEVAESGTRAGAATVIEAVEECAMETPEIKYVTLDRPFLFIIFETENSTPLFIGTYEKE